jgi:hypothetical protein
MIFLKNRGGICLGWVFKDKKIQKKGDFCGKFAEYQKDKRKVTNKIVGIT